MTFRKNETGSITLEAAMVLPLFLAFVLVLITVIRLTVIQMALQNATSEMTKQVATHIYPISYAFEVLQSSPLGEAIQNVYDLATSSEAREGKAKELIGQQIDTLITDPIADGLQKEMENQGLPPEASQPMTDFIKEHVLSVATDQMKETVSEELLSPVREANESLDQYTERIENQAKAKLQGVFNNALQPFVMSFMDTEFVDKEHLKVTQITLPNFTDPHPKFGVEVEYTVKLIVPFISYDFTLKSKSLERVWSGYSP